MLPLLVYENEKKYLYINPKDKQDGFPQLNNRFISTFVVWNLLYNNVWQNRIPYNTFKDVQTLLLVYYAKFH